MEVKNGHFKGLIPWYDTPHDRWYPEYYGYPEYNEEIFDYAHNKTCSCSRGWTDSTIETQDFQIKRKIELNLTDQSWPWINGLGCNDEMEESECYFYLRQYDAFDLSIENVAKDGCIVCYGVGPDLWPIHQDQLMKRLTRSDGDKLIHYEDCSPKSGYHKSRLNEVYRCEGGDDKVGVMAFTEANGGTDYECGYHDWFNAEYVIHDYYSKYPIFSVSLLFNL